MLLPASSRRVGSIFGPRAGEETATLLRKTVCQHVIIVEQVARSDADLDALDQLIIDAQVGDDIAFGAIIDRMPGGVGVEVASVLRFDAMSTFGTIVSAPIGAQER